MSRRKMTNHHSFVTVSSSHLAGDVGGHVLFVLWPIEMCSEEKERIAIRASRILPIIETLLNVVMLHTVGLCS